ncbi:MAG: hypothetical protein M3N29_02205 [Chloroflexota bacterium]|nr:hypothetical protein [Chloroflexota bacterium]
MSGSSRFAHASEAELARILDYYAVEWQYEPRTFPILWNQDGTVVESFSPDFYLPELDTYIELTTLKQSLVRRKNRKLRRLRELYPDIRIKLFYGKDFKALMLKYGRFDLAASLSGLEGQALAARLARAVDAIAAPAAPAREAVALEAGARPIADAPAAETGAREPGDVRRRASRGSRRRRGRRLHAATLAATLPAFDDGAS